MTSFTQTINLDLSQCLRSAISRPPRSFAQWLVEDVVIPDGIYEGERFSFKRQPITKLWANEIDSGRWSEFVYTGCSQSGKSFIGYVCPLIYHAVELGDNCVLAVPLEEMASDKWDQDIRPVMQHSARMRGLLPTHGAGSAGGKVKDSITLSDGTALKIMTKGGSDQGKAGFTARVIAVTELAGFSRNTAGSREAMPLRQLQARQRSYRNDERRTYLEGTKTVESELPWTLKPTSSRSRIVCPCPSCERWVCPEREHLKGWEGAGSVRKAMDLARWYCPNCDEPMSEEERIASLMEAKLLHGDQTIDRKGRISGDMPDTDRLWFDYGAFHNAFLTAGDIAKDCWLKEQIPEDDIEGREDAEKSLSQFVFGTCYRPPILVDPVVVTADMIATTRQVKWKCGIVPDDTSRLMIGVDLGEHHGYYSITAFRSTMQAHITDYGKFDIPSAEHDIETALFLALKDLWELVGGSYPTASGKQKAVDQMLIDSNYHGEAVYTFIKWARKQGVDDETIYPVLGRGETQMGKVRYVAAQKTNNEIREVDPYGRYHITWVRKQQLRRMILDADAFKIKVQRALKVQSENKGSLTLFAAPHAGQHKRISQHLVSEELKIVDGKRVWEVHGANHWLDTVAYAWAGAYRLGWDPTGDAAELEENTDQSSPEGQPWRP